MNAIKTVIKSLKNDGIRKTFTRIKKHFQNEEKKEYYKWIKKNTPSKKEIKAQRQHKFSNTPKISIVIPLYNTPKKYLLELINYVQNQTYSNWELCLADGSTKPLEYLTKVVEKDKKIKYQILKENKGISGNTNEALKLATGDYIALLDHDDLLPINSLYEIVKAINENPEAEFIFTDEDKFTDIKKKTRYEPNFKPDYAFDTFTSYNYICHFSVFKKELMDKLKGFNEQFDGSQDYDLILRAVENAKQVVHIPKILYHWRVHPSSTAGNAAAKPYCFEAGKNAVQAHLKRKGLTQGKMEFGVAIVRNRAIYDIKEKTKVSILLYLQDERIDLNKLSQDINEITYDNYEIIVLAIKKIAEKAEYESFSKNDKIKKSIIIENDRVIAKFNELAKQVNSDQIIFAKDFQDIKTKDFIEQLLGYAQRGDVGVISPRIIYKYTSSQYNGTVYGIDKDKTGYLDYSDVAGSFGYITRGAVVQNYSIIKSECMMVNKKDLEQIGYLSEKMDYCDCFADLSFSLRQKLKKINVINPHIEIESLEITTKTGKNKFYQKWEKELQKPDPNYNVNLKFEKDELFKINA
ncbi:MAG: glycosyltransferase [Clostridia bacterium]|nr:glycosyltransferase [Clostridia bacterium]